MPPDSGAAGSFEARPREFIERFQKMADETPQLIADIAGLVASLPPDQLLHRASLERFAYFEGVRDDTGIGSEQMVAQRMLDYVQSVIASVKPAANRKEELSDSDWEALRSAIDRLFGFHIEAFTAMREQHQHQFEESAEERHASLLKSSLVRYWYSVWGKRFPSHLRQYLSDLLLPHSSILEELFDLSASDLVDALVTIDTALRFGHAVTLRDLLRSGMLPDKREAVQHEEEPVPQSVPAWVSRAADELAWPTTPDDILDRAHGLAIFDVQRNTRLPEALLRELSWEPGEDDEFFAPGDLAGSPLREWPIFKRPFIRLDGRSYCFDPSRLADHIYLTLFRLVTRLQPEHKPEWVETEAKQMEHLAAKYFEKLLPGATVFTNIHYGGHGIRGETDALVLYDDHMLVIEVKGGEYTDLPPATDFDDHIRSVQRLGVVPSNQGARFLSYLEAGEPSPIYDSNNKSTRKRLADIRLSEYRHTSLVSVTREQFTELAAQFHHLQEFGIDSGSRAVWLLSLDDLHVYADYFDNALVFLHYVEQRQKASRSQLLKIDDELDHLGMYVAYSNYESVVGSMISKESVDVARYFGYRTDIESFFNQRLMGVNESTPLRRKMPTRFAAIIDYLASATMPGRSRVASHLLGLSDEMRTSLSEAIDAEMARHPTTRRPQPLSTYGPGEQVTVFCWSSHTGPRNAEVALRHAQSVVVMHEEGARLLLELTYHPDGQLSEVDWRWLSYAEIPSSALPGLEEDAIQQRRQRKARALQERREARAANPKTTPRKIGRNEPCVCGSGKKYKRCCIDLDVSGPASRQG